MAKTKVKLNNGSTLQFKGKKGAKLTSMGAQAILEAAQAKVPPTKTKNKLMLVGAK